MRDPYLDDGDVRLYAGDCVEVMAELPEASVDAVCTDPPYLLGFMGREWDRVEQKAAQDWHGRWAAEALRVLKPGGHLLAFGGTRTYHRLACAIEDAGFEVRDCLVWLYGSGFPKSLDVSKAIDRAAGAEREVVGSKLGRPGYRGGETGPRGVDYGDGLSNGDAKAEITAPATPEAAAWAGWGTALKPGHEPIILARKPIAERTVAAQVLATGTGALNVDGCRIRTNETLSRPGSPDTFAKWSVENGGQKTHHRLGLPRPDKPEPAGRWPANVVLDEEAAALLDAEVGERASGQPRNERGKGGIWSAGNGVPCGPQYGDTGGPSRFFYTSKAGADEREGSKHPTVKPLALMRWLVRLVTPPSGLVLDPFAGSGTTLRAAREEGFRAIGIEREPEYLADAAHRLRQLSLLGAL